MSEVEPGARPGDAPAARTDLNPTYHGAPNPHGPQLPLRREAGEQDVADALLADVRARPPLAHEAAAPRPAEIDGERAAAPVPGWARRDTIAPRGYVAETWARFRRDHVSLAALGLLVIIILLTLVGPWVAQQTLGLDPNRQTLSRRYQPPSPTNPFGTDDLGRDVLARTLVAGRVSFSIGMIIAFVSLAVGVPVGLASGYFGGRFDDVSNAVIQTLANIPGMFLLILLSVTFRSTEFRAQIGDTRIEVPIPWTIMLAIIIGLLGWMGTARLVRGMALSVREREYVRAAEALGASNRRIIARHLFPNVFSIVTVIAGFDVAGGILAESGLSYLGLGVQPPTASWGNMLGSSLENVTRAPWLVLFPGLAICLTTLAIFLIADGLRDALDPRLRA